MNLHVVALSAVCALGGFGAVRAEAALTTYTLGGAVTSIGGSGDVLGVQGVVGGGVLGWTGVENTDAFISGLSGIQPSGAWGGLGAMVININGHTVGSNVYQCTVDQQSIPGMNIVEIFPIGNSMMVDNVPIGNFGSFYLHLVFVSPTAFPIGTMPNLTAYTLDPTLSFGRMLEFNGGGSDSIDFSIVQVVPGPGALALLTAGGLLTAGRRRRA